MNQTGKLYHLKEINRPWWARVPSENGEIAGGLNAVPSLSFYHVFQLDPKTGENELYGG